MIVAERKPFDEIADSVKEYNKILLLGCGGCVTVCFSGGAKAIELLASQLKMNRKKRDSPVEIIESTPLRQCENECIDELSESLASAEVILSTACGVGVQTMSERFPDKIIIPALNTKFMGYPVQHGFWEERCAGCGDCILEWTGGYCPIARCAKRLLNGPCGGSCDGKCEVGGETPCVWQLIYDKLTKTGKIENLKKIQKPKDWRPSTYTGQRSVKFEEEML